MAHTFDLFSPQSRAGSAQSRLDWPDAERFPLNISGVSKVEDTILNDLKQSVDPLLIVGFASLDRLIDFIASRHDKANARILLGSEPFSSNRENFELEGASFEKEIEEYWLERGISLLLSARLVITIERLKEGVVQVRKYPGSERQHAKIYCGDDAASIGSSNFTEPGLTRQLEANVRFSRKKEATRFEQTWQIAENYWSLGKDFNQALIALLEKLLKVVPWREALARSCAELLEGEWAQRFIKEATLSEDAGLWPSQKKGIAQALYIISSHDSVLVADATGAGKTRMGVYLIQSLIEQIIRSNRIRRGKTLMVCPPTIEENWVREGIKAGVAFDVYSHGSLSHTRSHKHELTLTSLRHAQILCVDEGHNFLSTKSNRSKYLLQNMADNVLLFTATPINKSVTDLVRMADLLGADNLDESTVEAFRRLLGAKNINRALTEPETDLLRNEIQRFTVRRTKAMLNALIDQEPGAYRDAGGRRCRFPGHKAEIYPLKEPESECRLALEIRELAEQLYAVAFFQRPVEMPELLRIRGVSEADYLAGRLLSAKKIAAYLVMSSLRSSRAALLEHIAGTNEAITCYQLANFKRSSKLPGMLSRLNKVEGKLPGNKLSIALPDWLSGKREHVKACRHDAAIYSRIQERLKLMTDMRETQKASLLNKLLGKHKLLLAFDSRPITLAAIQKRLEKAERKPTVLVATGDAISDRAKIIEMFKPGSTETNIIGLCSDSLSEGVNLQQASAIVHLDMPSVVRIAEQRVGRIDRLDSPHKTIQAFWPRDAAAFALAADERFIERYEAVESLIGANMPLPEGIQANQKSSTVSTEQLIKEYEEKTKSMHWDGIHDAFEPVRRLVSGDSRLIPEQTYEHYKAVTSRVMSHVSLVKSSTPWAFFSIAAGVFGAPRWIFLPGLEAQAITELPRVCAALREHLNEDVEDLAMSNTAEGYLEKFLETLAKEERQLISRKKQKALVEMTIILKTYIKQASSQGNQQKLDAYSAILDAIESPLIAAQPDWDELAARWIDIVRPYWYERLNKGNSKLLQLKNLRKELREKEAEFGKKIIRTFSQFPILPPPDKRIAACILGVA